MHQSCDVCATGIEGLDAILGGGLPRNAMHLLQGVPGSGKTTFALQYLLAAAARGEPGLYVTLSETRGELLRIARSHGWSLEPLHLLELATIRETARAEAGQTMFHPAEVELDEVTRPILDEVERLRPLHVVIDSLSEIRLLAGELLRFRRQILALKQFFAERNCTVLLLDDRTADMGGTLLESLAHGVVSLEKQSPSYGRMRRRMSVDKMRGVAYSEGFHDFRILTGRFVVYPRLVSRPPGARVARESLPSGVEGLDRLLGGGPDRGTSTLLLGPAGVGKSSIAMQYVTAAAERGEHGAMFLFDETVDTMLSRAASLGMRLEEHVRSGRVSLRQLDPAELTAGEFSHAVREAVAREDARIVVIDSLNGLMDSLADEQFLTMHVRELLTYLNQLGVATLNVLAQHGLVGAASHVPVDVSYLADNVLLLRYFEARGRIRKAISTFKKRSGPHEASIREFSMGPGGFRVGEPIEDFQGILTGVPAYVGAAATLPDGP